MLISVQKLTDGRIIVKNAIGVIVLTLSKDQARTLSDLLIVATKDK